MHFQPKSYRKNRDLKSCVFPILCNAYFYNLTIAVGCFASVLLITFWCVPAGIALEKITVAGREQTSFNDDWRFVKDDPAGTGDALSYMRTSNWLVATGNELLNAAAAKPALPVGNLGAEVTYTRAEFDDRAWRQLDLPHDWGIEGEFDQEYPGETGKLPWWGVGWYRKHFFLPTEDAKKRIYLDVDGAMAYATVWLNGQFVGGWPYGYSSWQLELTPFLRFGAENVLAIRLDNPKDSSRWYPGAGIYRNVWLVKTEQIHIAHWGVFVSAPQVTAETALVKVQTTVENHLATPAPFEASTELFELDAEGRIVAKMIASTASTTTPRPIESGQSGLVVQYLTVSHPKLWSIKSPQRYVAITTVRTGDQTVDRVETRFGIRSIAFSADHGFFLNGERIPIQGVCLHHDLGALGTALNVRALERQLKILREMGANAIRTSHNPPAPELLDLCDRMGFLVMDEAFDCWLQGKRPNDYHLLFSDWHEKDLRALVRRDRNHPSVILWSIGNEIREQNSPEGWKVAAHLASLVHDEDRTRPVTAGCNSPNASLNGLQSMLDVSGFNYQPQGYKPFRLIAPLQPLVATETASCLSSRGEYYFPIRDDNGQRRTVKDIADFQVSSYDFATWAFDPQTEFRGLDEAPFVAGEFVWTGFDYLGEPEPYSKDSSTSLLFTDPILKERATDELRETGKIRVPSRSSYFGIVDLAGFKKDRFYLYQARWRPNFPMAHILPHWNWPERVAQVTPVHVYTSGDEAELFLNEKSLGRKKRGPFDYRLRWDDVRYEPGELRVIAYKNGRKWAEDSLRTTGPAAMLVVSADRTVLRADGHELAFITVKIADKNGLLVPRAKNRVTFDASGPGEIVATDNGDATSFESFQSKQRAAFNGLVLVIIRTKAGAHGTIHLRAMSKGLAGADVSINSGR